jgi:hypothetical protein
MSTMRRARPIRPARWLPETQTGWSILAFFALGFPIVLGDTMIVASHRSKTPALEILGGLLMATGPLSAIALMIVGRRAAKRASQRPGLCVTCGYNLTGNQSGICPECGKPIKHPEP